jgi:uncharacterized repeat protein (TIGR02543 family)
MTTPSGSAGNGQALWKTDGTTAGTQKVRDINTYAYQEPSNSYYYTVDSRIQNLTQCNGKMFFTANDLGQWTESELWVTDGTDAGTHLVKDINTTNTVPSYQIYSQVLNSTIASNGTISQGSTPQYLTCMGNTLYFSANDGTGQHLWKSDGTDGGTSKVRLTSAGDYPVNPSNLKVLAGKLIFSATHSGGYGAEPWITDGTSAGTVMLKDIFANSSSSSPNNFVVFNSNIFFVATDSRGAELWKTDGTNVGTLFVKDINTVGSGTSSNPKNMYVWNGKLYFTADDGVLGRELYSTSGTGVTTQLVKDIFPGISDILDISNNSTNAPYFAGSTNALIFTANSPIYGQEMWYTDGTDAGTQVLQDLDTRPGYANTHDGIAFNGKIYFSAASAYFGQELWSTDLTTGNTKQVIDIYPGASSGMDSTNSYFTVYKGRLYFTARNAVTGYELWSTDGTAAGTKNETDLYPGYGYNAWYYFPTYLTVCNGKLYFAQYSQSGGYNIQGYDGTNPPTAVASTHLFAQNIICMNNVLYFTAENYAASSYDREVWKSDGTSAGTSLLYDAYPGTYYSTYGNGSNPGNLTVYNNNLYFTAYNPSTGTELYRSDGTNAGTSIMDLNSGAATSDPSALTVFNGELWFKATIGATGSDMYSFDGTTRTARDFVSGTGGFTVDGKMVTSGGRFWFASNFPPYTYGTELNSSDGTAANSGVFEDLSPNGSSTTISNLTAIGGILLYNTYDSVMGSQPRFVVVSNVSTVSFNGNGNTGGTAPNDISVMSISATVPGNTGAMVKTNYNFVGWNTNAIGTGTTYLPGSTISPIVDTPLYAMWASVTPYTITYNANGAASGAVAPPVTNVTSMVTLDDNSGALAKPGYTFGGWALNTGGTGTIYPGGSRYTAVADVTLYAKWNALPTYSISFDKNTGTGTAPTSISTYLTATITLPAQGSMIPPAGKMFAGWNTNAAGTGTSYAASETLSPQSSMTLYAKWTVPPPSTLTYNANGATSGSVPTSLVATNTYVVIDSNTGNLFKTGYVFSGWNTQADGLGTTYQGTDNYLLSADVTLYAKWVAANYTVTFSGNGNTGGGAPAAATGISVSTVLPGNSGSLVKAGYTFGGWNTLPSGLGTNYAVGDTFSPISNVTLYAKWTALPTYSITYNSNGATSGGAPVTQTGVYSSVTLDNNSGNLAKSGSYFSGWNTQADGLGTTYPAGSSFTPSSNTTLYALWSANPTFTLTYLGNSNTSGTVPLPQTGISSTATVSGNTGTLARLGYRFDGWNTAANGSGMPYAATDTITLSADTSLYAQWISVPTYTITFSGNGQTSGSIPSAITSSDANVTLPGNTGVLNKTNYTFNGWNTLANGTGTHYDVGAAFPLTANVTLYAEWLGNIYTITYNANGSTSGTVPIATSGRGTLTTALNTGTLAKAGYTFAGWNTAGDGTGSTVVAGGTYTPTQNMTLFAKWTALPTYTITYNGNSSDGGSVPTSTTSYTTMTIAGPGSMSRTNYGFAGWNTAANGSGTNYAVGDSYSTSANLTLYAKWSPRYDLSFDGNGFTGGSAPSSILQTVITNASAPGSLVKSGYRFAGWNTAANGTGTPYAANASITLTANTTLYAQWTAVYDLTYDGNTSDGGSVAVSEVGITSTTAAPTGSLTKSGYAFTGWNTAADGSGTNYAPGAAVNLNANLTLYAQWTQNAFAITYFGNGATTGSAPSPIASVTNSITVQGNVGLFALKDYVFAGWNTQADGKGTKYLPGAVIAISANMNLFAQWVMPPPPPRFSISSLSKKKMDVSGGSLEVVGTDLTLVTYVAIDGEKLTIAYSSDAKLVLLIAPQKAGKASLVFNGEHQIWTSQDAIEFFAPATKMISATLDKSGKFAQSTINFILLEARRNRDYSSMQIGFLEQSSANGKLTSLSVEQNMQLLILARQLVNLVDSNIQVAVQLHGDVSQIVLTFTVK